MSKAIEREDFELDYPITIGGAEVSVLKLRRPKAFDLKKMNKGGQAQLEKFQFERMIALIADLAEITPKEVEELDAADLTRVSSWVGEILGDSQETTAT